MIVISAMQIEKPNFKKKACLSIGYTITIGEDEIRKPYNPINQNLLYEFEKTDDLSHSPIYINKKIIFIHGIATPNLLDPIKGLFSQPKQFKKEDIGRILDVSGNFGRYKIIKNHQHYGMTNFCWYSSDYERGGILSKTGRYEAAQALFTFLSEDNELQNKEISIIAHSHGGNVATELLRVIAEHKSDLRIKNLAFYETPKGRTTEEGVHQKSGEEYIAEHVFDINLDYSKEYCSQRKEQEKFTQIIDIFHQFPHCFRRFLKGRDGLKEIILQDKKLRHNSIEDVIHFVKKIFDNQNQNPFNKDELLIQENKQKGFFKDINGSHYQYFCYYILPSITQSSIILFIIYTIDKRYYQSKGLIALKEILQRTKTLYS